MPSQQQQKAGRLHCDGAEVSNSACFHPHTDLQQIYFFKLKIQSQQHFGGPDASTKGISLFKNSCWLYSREASYSLQWEVINLQCNDILKKNSTFSLDLYYNRTQLLHFEFCQKSFWKFFSLLIYVKAYVKCLILSLGLRSLYSLALYRTRLITPVSGVVTEAVSCRGTCPQPEAQTIKGKTAAVRLNLRAEGQPCISSDTGNQSQRASDANCLRCEKRLLLSFTFLRIDHLCQLDLRFRRIIFPFSILYQWRQEKDRPYSTFVLGRG